MNEKNYPEYFRYSNDFEPVPAVVLGSHKIGLGIIRALGIKKIPVVSVYYNDFDMGIASKYVIEKVKIENPLINEEKFINRLVELSGKYNNAVLFASDDPTLVAVSKFKNLLAGYYKVEAPDYALLDKIITKTNTNALAEKISVRCPKTFHPKDFNEALNYLNFLNGKCILKPSVSHLFFNIFKEKMLLINSEPELRNAYKKISGYGLEMMLQEFIPGDDECGINYNTFSVNGEVLIEFTARKKRLSPTRIGFPVVIESKWIPEVRTSGKKIIKELGYTGFSCMEFKRHNLTGEYVLMEVNGRQNLSAPLAVMCGYNFPYITYRYLLDKSVPVITSDYEKGVYWVDTGKDMMQYLPLLIKGEYSFSKFLKPYLSKKVFTIYDLKDIKPFVKRIFDATKFIKSKLFNKIGIKYAS